MTQKYFGFKAYEDLKNRFGNPTDFPTEGEVRMAYTNGGTYALVVFLRGARIWECEIYDFVDAQTRWDPEPMDKNEWSVAVLYNFQAQDVLEQIVSTLP